MLASFPLSSVFHNKELVRLHPPPVTSEFPFEYNYEVKDFSIFAVKPRSIFWF